MKTTPLVSGLSLPVDFDVTPLGLYERCLSLSDFAAYSEPVNALLSSEADACADILSSLPHHEFEHVIHVLHISMFMRRHLQDVQYHKDVVTPVTDAIARMTKELPLDEVLSRLPKTITDVLTAHPVDMDRGLVVKYKQDTVSLAYEWEQKKVLYALTKDPSIALSLRAELNAIHTTLTNTMMMVLHTSNYRIVKIKPESEQRHLSRSIKSMELWIIEHWSKLISIVQEQCATQLKEIGDPALRQAIEQLSSTMRYQLETWRGDMDGNIFVTADTVAKSTAYARKRCFEMLSADDAVIRYDVNTAQFNALESDISDRLHVLRDTGKETWVRYIQERESEQWSPVQIYSGLAYFRMVELMDGAELFSRSPSSLDLLKEGFESAREYLSFTDVLENIELASGIKNGFWKTCRNLVELRGVSLGRPHCRKGESFHVELMDAYCAEVCPNQFSTGAFSTAPDAEKRQFLIDFEPVPVALPNNDLLETYINIMRLEPETTLVQSDSGESMTSIYDSILLLNAISKLIGHKGKCAVLCENESSMVSAIEVMSAPPSETCFDSVIMMCAGSDNQKKLGPFYSAYLNHKFLKTAAQQGIDTFFGVGDSPLRSSEHMPRCDMKTFQPGSRKLFFNPQQLHAYLSDRLAVQIYRELELNHEISEVYESIFKCFSESMYSAYKEMIVTQTQLQSDILSISEIVTTYFSRPSKKRKQNSTILETLRAIDSARAQLILNTFDPQLSGLQSGLDAFFRSMATAGITASQIQSFFNETDEGAAILKTLTYYMDMLDDALPTSDAIRTVSAHDVQAAYSRLSGRAYTLKPDTHLRLCRMVWRHIESTPELEPVKAQALMLFGANWMV